MIPYKFSKYYLPILIFWAAIVTVVTIVSERNRSEKNKETTWLTNDISINGTIQTFEINKAFCDIKLNTGKRYLINWAKNNNYNPVSFCEFIKPGDTISKSINTDTIIIKRNNIKYFFVMGKRVSKE